MQQLMGDRLAQKRKELRKRANETELNRLRHLAPESAALLRKSMSEQASEFELSSLLAQIKNPEASPASRNYSIIVLANFLSNRGPTELGFVVAEGIVYLAEILLGQTDYQEAAAFLLFNLSFFEVGSQVEPRLRHAALLLVSERELKDSAKEDLVIFIKNSWKTGQQKQQYQLLENNRSVIRLMAGRLKQHPGLLEACLGLCRVKDGAEVLFEEGFMKALCELVKETGYEQLPWHQSLFALLNLVLQELSDVNLRQAELFKLLRASCERLQPTPMHTYLLLIHCESSWARVDCGLFIRTWLFFVEMHKDQDPDKLVIALRSLIAFLYEGEYYAEEKGLTFNVYLREFREQGGTELLYQLRGEAVDQLVDTIELNFIDYGA